nr:TlpA disulfide reductase family protein [Xanthomonas euvesicatoria]
MTKKFPWLRVGVMVACVLCFLLSWQNRQLRLQQQVLQERARGPYEGMYVPQVEVTDGKGLRHMLGSPEAQVQVLFFFTATCPYCKRSASTVLRAAHQLQASLANPPQVLGVCNCDAAQAAKFAQLHGFDFPVVTLSDKRELALFRALQVPTLIAIDGQGRVRYSHVGVFNTMERVNELAAALRHK